MEPSEAWFLAYAIILGEVLIPPHTLHLILMFGAITLLLLFTAIVSGSEVALFSLSLTEFGKLSNTSNRSNRRIQNLLKDPKKILAVILVAKTLFNVSLIVISTVIAIQLFNVFDYNIWVFFVQVAIVWLLILIFGEIIPKTVAANNPLSFSRFVAPYIQTLSWVLHPVVVLLVRKYYSVDFHPTNKGRKSTITELGQALELTSNRATPETEKTILKQIVKFGDTEAKEIMRPRIDIVAVDMHIGFDKLRQVILDAGYSRIPVYDGSFDQISGIIYVKDLLPYINTDNVDFNWRQYIRQAFFVPENKKIKDLLQEFRAKKIHLAVVVDEYGGTSGIVTLEDIIEEIVGEINDESDVEGEETLYSKIDESNYIFEGKILLNDFCKVAGVEEKYFLQARGESETLAGLLLERLGRIPEKGESITIGSFTFFVDSVDKRRIKKIRITIPHG
ncbi:MAG TPA: gliding motility-associated protein GldE [Bacteroidales bacterium]|nr:gliding motility-associated protein GldE [Bacteroidales bacterium]